MQFHWTNHYNSSGTNLAAQPGTALLVIDYRAVQSEAMVLPRLGRMSQENALAIAVIFADALIEGRDASVLRSEPDLVIQVRQ